MVHADKVVSNFAASTFTDATLPQRRGHVLPHTSDACAANDGIRVLPALVLLCFCSAGRFQDRIAAILQLVSTPAPQASPDKWLSRSLSEHSPRSTAQRASAECRTDASDTIAGVRSSSQGRGVVGSVRQAVCATPNSHEHAPRSVTLEGILDQVKVIFSALAISGVLPAGMLESMLQLTLEHILTAGWNHVRRQHVNGQQHMAWLAGSADSPGNGQGRSKKPGLAKHGLNESAEQLISDNFRDVKGTFRTP